MNPINLPHNLQPAEFLWDVGYRLGKRSQDAVALCQAACKTGDPQQLEQALEQAGALWRRYGERIGHGVAFLWLADGRRQRGEYSQAIEHCRTATQSIPAGPPPTFTIIKATACYIYGLAAQASDDLQAAVREYTQALDLFEAMWGYWQHVGRDERAQAYAEVLGYIHHTLLPQVKTHAATSAPAAPLAAPPKPPSAGDAPSSLASWLELAHLPVLWKAIPAGAPYDLSVFLARRPHGKVQVHQFFINDSPYQVRALRKDRRGAPLESGHEYVIIPVQGDSMDKEDIVTGDYVVLQWLKGGEELPARCVVAAEVSGERYATLKQYVKTGGKQYLRARSSKPEWRKYKIEIKDDGSVSIRGLAVAVLKPVSEN